MKMGKFFGKPNDTLKKGSKIFKENQSIKIYFSQLFRLFYKPKDLPWPLIVLRVAHSDE